MFDHIAEAIYPDVPVRYAASCEIGRPAYDVGQKLESFVCRRYPTVTASPSGLLRPVFVHCEGSRVFVNKLTGSKVCPDQVKLALDFVRDFLWTTEVDGSRVRLLAPYAANVGLINRMVKKSEYALLSSMEPAMTIESFQGRETDIAVVVFGTAHPSSGPGFTGNEQRLNVMLSRQRCGLVMFGDINVTGEINDKGGKGGKAKAKVGKNAAKFRVLGISGETSYVKAVALKALNQHWFDQGRVARVAAREN